MINIECRLQCRAFADIIRITTMRGRQIDAKCWLVWVSFNGARKAFNRIHIIVISQRAHPTRVKEAWVVRMKHQCIFKPLALLMTITAAPRIKGVIEQLFDGSVT